jgi:hypothetical protein
MYMYVCLRNKRCSWEKHYAKKAHGRRSSFGHWLKVKSASRSHSFTPRLSVEKMVDRGTICFHVLANKEGYMADKGSG